jgi:hypothetical protein
MTAPHLHTFKDGFLTGHASDFYDDVRAMLKDDTPTNRFKRHGLTHVIYEWEDGYSIEVEGVKGMQLMCHISVYPNKRRCDVCLFEARKALYDEFDEDFVDAYFCSCRISEEQQRGTQGAHDSMRRLTYSDMFDEGSSSEEEDALERRSRCQPMVGLPDDVSEDE